VTRKRGFAFRTSGWPPAGRASADPRSARSAPKPATFRAFPALRAMNLITIHAGKVLSSFGL
jgi:hypothetical protein